MRRKIEKMHLTSNSYEFPIQSFAFASSYLNVLSLNYSTSLGAHTSVFR
jgi:hypothetical protein